ncbi:LysR family transcriptional regulator [Bordetella sp. 15P40C-2]|uniref:LysR family transcriptional regulator n=1 Tax=Bordetella sp. 15P40C-2 TaxID=2572246 RepID=UPI00132BF98A|nr:LysR family transcriptional regulator [Bordetella sp. 15P40C-2]MVW71109.1 LysR family transcriptional regulator [Bordetella sp. 15P40C-2]
MSSANITLKQLRAFTAVAREGSFTRASEKLHVTQSTLTTSIKILESEIGVRLFDRSTRAVLLTAQGTQFLPAAERMLRDLTESLEELRLTVTRQRGSAVVAAAASFINYVMSPAVMEMASRYPGISVRMREETTEGVCRLVLGGDADFGVTTLFQTVPELDSTLILTDDYGAVYHSGHALAQEDSPMPWSRLASHTMVALHPSNGIRALVDLHPRIATRYKKPAYEVGSMSTLLPLLQRGLGYAALPALAAAPLVTAGLKFKPLRQPVLRRNLYIVKKRGRALSPSAYAMLEAMTRAVQRIDVHAQVDVAFNEARMREFAG